MNDHLGQLPSQFRRILRTGVEALSTHQVMHMCRVAGQQVRLSRSARPAAPYRWKEHAIRLRTHALADSQAASAHALNSCKGMGSDGDAPGAPSAADVLNLRASPGHRVLRVLTGSPPPTL